MRSVLAGVAFVAALLPAPLAEARLVAGRITENGPVGWHLGGPDRDAGLGDWALGNGTVCAAVSDPAHEGMIYPSGGVLVDIGRCGREDDQWTTFETMWNLSRGTTVVVDHIEAGADEERAWILTRGRRDGVEVVLRYEVDLAEPEALHVRLRIERVAAGPRFFSLSLIALHPSGQMRPFSLFRAAPERSVGFAYPESDPGSTLSLLRALLPVDLHVLVGAEGLPGLAYGLERRRAQRVYAEGRERRAIPSMATTGVESTVTGVFAEPYLIGEGDPPGMLELAQTMFMDLEIGDRLEVDWRLWVTERADVASVTDRIWPDAPVLRGVVDDPETRIHVQRADGSPMTVARVDDDGRFAFRLPPGSRQLVFRTRTGADVVRDVMVGEDDLDLGEVSVGRPAVVLLPRSGPMRLIFEGQGDTPDPVFGDDLLGFRLGEAPVPTTQQTRHVALAGGATDPRRVLLPPGRYRVTATRGPEFGVAQTDLVVEAGETTALEVSVPLRVLETPGWIAADLHVHSGRSFDTSWPVDRQVAAFAAEGAEVLVSTEHDRVFDPGPVVRRLGLDDRIVGLPGVEVTSVAETEEVPHTLGHLNAFPLEPTLGPRGGAPAAEGRRLREVLADERLGGTLRQLNHPRTAGRAAKGAYFTHLGIAGEPFDPTRELTAEPNRVLVEADPETGVRDVDFDAIEGINGEHFESYRRVRADWLALLLQGERRTLTANSDSHRASQVVAYPRTYVRLDDDEVGSFSTTAFVRALRAGRAFGTTGPIPMVRLGAAEIGDTYVGSTGDLTVSVAAAPWVPVDELRVYVNGALAARRSIEAGDTVAIPLDVERDSFVTVELEGEPDAIYETVAPGFVPFAFTNPIFVDADGDGTWVPPGLSSDLPDTLTSPDESS